MKDELDRQIERIDNEVSIRLATAALAGLEQLTELLRQPVSRNPDPVEKLAIAKEILDRFEGMQQEHRASREQRVISQLQRIVS